MTLSDHLPMELADDDSDSKARRNLLVFSSGLLLAWFIDLPEGLLWQRLVGFPPGSISSARVWTAVIVVLAYLLVRWRFSADGHSGRNLLRAEMWSERKRVSSAYYRRLLRQFNRSRIESPLFGSALSSFDDRQARGMNPHLTPGAKMIIDPLITEVVEGSRSDTLNVQWVCRDPHFVAQLGREEIFGDPVLVTLPIVPWHLVNVGAAVRLALYSNAAVVILLPLGVSAAAWCLAFYKLASTWELHRYLSP